MYHRHTYYPTKGWAAARPKQPVRIGLLWRLAALLALTLYGLIILTVIRLVLDSFGIALVIGPTTAFLVYSAWLIFTGSSMRQRRGIGFLALGLSALIVEFAVFFQDINHRRLLLGIAALVVLYTGVIWALRHAYWKERRRISRTSTNLARFSNPYLIINPKSGNGRAIKSRIGALAADQGIKVRIVTKGDDVESLARRAAESGADVLGISGGDGSIGAVAKVAIEYDLPIVVLPGGTRCHFARDLGLQPRHIADALAGFAGNERRVDAGSINGRIFLNNVSFGLYADIVNHPDYRNKKLRVIRRTLAGGSLKPYDLEFDHGSKHYTTAVQVLVGVNRYETIHLLEIGHRQSMSEGVLQVTVLTELNDAMVLQLLKPAPFDHLLKQQNAAAVKQWTTTTFRVSSRTNSLVVGVDGEREEYIVPVTVSILPGALRVFVPPEDISRSRPHNAFSMAMLRYIWQSAVQEHPTYKATDTASKDNIGKSGRPFGRHISG